MPDRPQRVAVTRRVIAWSLAWLFAGALYLLLIDTTDLPELLVGAGAAALAASGFELAREQHIAGETVRPRWLQKLHRPVIRVASDIVIVSLAAVRQLWRRSPACGEFLAVRYRGEEREPFETGRRSLAEAVGSFAPNTIVVGIDGERRVILAHQLKRGDGPESVDLLELG